MKIVFLNIWHARRIKEVSEFIKEHRETTDVFCFQEAFDTTLKLGKELLNDFQVYTAGKTLNEEEDFSLATFVKNTSQVLNCEAILQDSLTEGMGLNTTVEHKGEIYNICNVHGVSRPGNKLDTPFRITQTKAFIDFYRNNPHYTIIGGDFNLEKNTESVGLFSDNGYEDLINSFQIKTTRNRLSWEKYPDSKQYYSDYVFVNHGLVPQNFQVPNNEVSDHLPLLVEV